MQQHTDCLSGALRNEHLVFGLCQILLTVKLFSLLVRPLVRRLSQVGSETRSSLSLGFHRCWCGCDDGYSKPRPIRPR